MGTHVSERLRHRGYTRTLIDRDGIHRDGEPRRTAMQPLSVDDYRNILADAHAFIWMACSTTPRNSEGHPLEELDGNIRPFLTMLDALQEHPDCHLIYISTGGAMYGDIPEGIANEERCIKPKSYYSAGKAALEHFASAFANQTTAPVTIIRPSNVYGPGQPYRPGFGIIPAAFYALMKDQAFPVWGDGGAVRDYLYIEDLVDLCMLALDHRPTDSPVLMHAASATGIRLDALLEEIEYVAGKKVIRDITASHSVDVSRVVLGNDEAHRRLGWSPVTSLPDGLAQTWAWFSEHYA
ncbi:hypothetical protein BTJ49_01590 [Oleiagrimonas sp. MCCC 1A03011]|nr:hypothetical protein BTJ49_01590 [Oleiagrimonas sp. MCCC 1A03011]